ncbi:MAG: tRNA (adenosine(37)-N6)-threonylcarbamoyltransferase complex dimerization subunit type 1 TsaB [Vitreoscilla sp.]|nr:tRNA (adenosine(37)-N6)-threonylcarbamoyltransferase complex dimerization subunit type 1 TsaB [Vitreoscilla sp.]MBP6675358.1 tRNA (adenosine(37)-N6)-threonylcarbamoyltransferase complex dimerization subunit type 1 TsaB [Vitreoscilla sp.]
MRLLALDTATERMAVALADGEAELLLNAEGGAAASATLLPAVLAQLAERQMHPADLQAIAFGCGPGAFTGLRTAVSVAQGLAFGIGCPVLAISSLLIVAEDARQQAGVPPGEPFAIWVAMDARMDEVYAAAYRFDGEQWHETSAPALYDLPTLQAVWQGQPPVKVAGSAITAFAERLPLGAAQPWPQVANRAAALLRLARWAWAHGPHLPADQALPLYLRDKVALTTAEREAARHAAASLP